MNKKMDKEIEMIFRDYLDERGNVPDYAKFLAEENPEFLINWFNTRRTFRGKGVLPEKFKEFLLMAGNATRLNEGGVTMHIEAAVKMGATKEEMLEVALCTWLIGGMPTLNVCLRAIMKFFQKK
jgi:alkylhydroperoxidase/carboxymuconolactone decarboxylase family protein YurZ